MQRPASPGEMVGHSIQQEGSGATHSTSQNDSGRVVRMLDVDRGDAQIHAGFVPDSPANNVAGFGALHDPGTIDRLAALEPVRQGAVLTVFHRSDDSARDRGRRRVLFETSMLSARAGQTVHLDDPMSKFGGVFKVTVHQTSVEQHARPDTGPEREHDQVIAATSRPDPRLAKRGGVAVVVQHDGAPKFLTKRVTKRHISPARKVG